MEEGLAQITSGTLLSSLKVFLSSKNTSALIPTVAIMNLLIIAMKQELLLQGFAPKTVKAYTNCVSIFFLWYQSNIRDLDEYDVRNFLLWLGTKNRSAKTIKRYKEALKFFCTNIVHVPFLGMSKRPKQNSFCQKMHSLTSSGK